MIRINTVRTKLTILVGLSALATLAALPVLSWVMNRQLIDQVGDRVPLATRTFRMQLKEQLRDVGNASGQLSRTRETVEALRTHDEKAAKLALAEFHETYPDLAIALFDAEGARLTEMGFHTPPQRVGDIEGLVEGLAALTPKDKGLYRDVLPRGCDRSKADEPPAYILAHRARAEVGTVLVCIPIDEAYFKKAAEKFGVEIALLGPDGQWRSGTEHFPLDRLEGLVDDASKPAIGGEGDALWASARYSPKSLKSRAGQFAIAVALDVSDIRRIVRHNLMYAVGALSIAALISLILGARLASVMSRALSRMNDALKKLEQQQYVHVEPIKTGDELEDLAKGFNSMVDGLRERDKLRSTFGKYMTQSVIDHLLAGKVELGGETLTVSILFSDIRSFTSISEKMNAQELVGLLNEYLTEMVAIVIDEDGVVDKYIGDAIMAVFGAPVPKADDAERAVRAAVRMRKALADLNERLALRGIPPIKTGIGIHTGEVVAGNIGSDARMEYTVIGDAVNLASRLESCTKDEGVDVLISDDTYALVKDSFVTRPVREITVKGRAQPVMTHEVQA